MRAILMILATAAHAEGADVVFLGEVHDNPRHHLAQAAEITQLAPKAVVFEMLTPALAARLDGAAIPDPEALSALLEWEARGWPPIEGYLPVFDALGAAVAVGAGSPRDEVRQAFAKGAAAVFGPDAGRFGLDQALPPDQLAARRELQFEAHCGAMPREMMGGMVEAQRFRDARIAEAALDALARFGAPVAVVTGNGHARTDWGAAGMVRGAGVSVLAVGHMELPQTPEPGFDRITWTAPAERDDPCAVFRK